MGTDRRQRNTRQRQVLLEELRKLDSHPTAAELYEIVRARLPKISLGTVYRNLEVLAKDGTISKLVMCGSEARFDGDRHPHYHVRCVCCGRVDDVEALPGTSLTSEVRQHSDYEILGVRVEYLGLCPECRQQPTPEGDDASPTDEDQKR
jgi:Fur family ferric uptake transcriptional regulator